MGKVEILFTFGCNTNTGCGDIGSPPFDFIQQLGHTVYAVQAVLDSDLFGEFFPQFNAKTGVLTRFEVINDEWLECFGGDMQDRALWNRAMISEGLATLDRAMARRLPGPFQIQAAINALHAQAETPDATDWPQIFLLYTRLEAFTPSPVVRLNRAVALAETGEIRAARCALDTMAVELDDYQPYHAAVADLARRDNDRTTAKAAYDRAIALSKNSQERDWLARRKAELR